MKKLLLLLLAYPLSFASCSSDDDKDIEPGVDTMTVTGKATAYNKIELEWSRVDEAYTYQVFYQAEGNTEWKTSNLKMANHNDPKTIYWDGTFASFASETKYTLYVKAFRDSRESSVIAESNKIEITTPSSIVGAWEKVKNTGYVKSNMPEYDEKLAEFIIKEFTIEGTDIANSKSIMHFNADFTFNAYENDVLDSEGTYKITNDFLTLTAAWDSDEEASDAIYEYSLANDNLVVTLDVKESLNSIYYKSPLIEIVGAANYEKFVFETASINVDFVRVK